jgi:thioredoxin reductase (NADPH)
MPPKLTKEEILKGAVDIDTDAQKEMTFDYDLLVIGGGSGGLAAAKKASELGARTALCDFVQPTPIGTTWGLGGTCVNVGCIPKKLMHTAGLQGEAMQHMAPHYGWSQGGADAPGPVCDWETLRGNVTMHIKSLNFGYTADLRKKGVKYFNAYAVLQDATTVSMTNKKGEVSTVTARRVIVATGGRPTILDIPGAEHCATSDDIFKLKQDPGKTLVVGASYVALECAGFLTGIGRDTAVMMRSIPLRGFDQDMANQAVDFMETSGTRFIRKCVPTAVVKNEETGKLSVTWKHVESEAETTEEFDTVLMAVGRKPETSKIGLAQIGVKLNESGHVIVDAFERTSVPNVYAIGDIIVGGLELTPVAIRASHLLSMRLYGMGSEVMNYDTVPTTVFTPLEYGCVGLSEENALKQYGEIEVYHSYFTPLEWTVPHRGDNVCYMKMIVNPFDDERVIGFHVLAPNAGEITQGVAVALKCGAKKRDFDETVGIHPVVAEDMTTLKVTKSSGGDAKKSGC